MSSIELAVVSVTYGNLCTSQCQGFDLFLHMMIFLDVDICCSRCLSVRDDNCGFFVSNMEWRWGWSGVDVNHPDFEKRCLSRKSVKSLHSSRPLTHLLAVSASFWRLQEVDYRKEVRTVFYTIQGKSSLVSLLSRDLMKESHTLMCQLS